MPTQPSQHSQPSQPKSPAAAAPASSSPTKPPVAAAAARSAPPLPTGPIDPNAVFSGKIEPTPISGGYVVAGVLASVLMVLLPFLYLALIGGVAYATFWHVTNPGWMLSSRNAMRGPLSVASLILGGGAGVLIIFFMLKPLLARGSDEWEPAPIPPKDEPLLHEFVAKLCEVTGAPVPREIYADPEVNASAGFTGGIVGFFRGDVRLAIGMPLAMSMDVRTLSGVIAHELGHFSQRLGMRSTYIVRIMNAWFERCVFERDIWDVMLWVMSESENLIVRIIGYAALSIVFVVRCILWCLWWIGTVGSCALLRAMEFDADRYEARVAGSRQFESATKQMIGLNMAFNTAAEELNRRKKSRRLPNDFPSLVASALRLVPPEQIDRAFRATCEEATSLFATHPANADRIRSALEEDAPGVVLIDAPAVALFRDPARWCKQVTYLKIRAETGEMFNRIDLVDNAEFTAVYRQSEKALRALESITPPAVARLFSIRSFFLRIESIDIEVSAADALKRWNAAREAMKQHKDAAIAAAPRILDADSMVDNAYQASALVRAGVRFDPASFGLKTASLRAADASRDEALMISSAAEADLEPFEQALRQRVASALLMLATPELKKIMPSAKALGVEAEKLLGSNAALREAFSSMHELSRRVLAAGAITSRAKSVERRETAKELTRLTGEMSTLLRSAHGQLTTTPYPFENATPYSTLAAAILEDTPDERDGPVVLAASQRFVDGYLVAARRVLARLIEISTLVEQTLKSSRG